LCCFAAVVSCAAAAVDFPVPFSHLRCLNNCCVHTGCCGALGAYDRQAVAASCCSSAQCTSQFSLAIRCLASRGTAIAAVAGQQPGSLALPMPPFLRFVEHLVEHSTCSTLALYA
jgi:hypothetical protein